MALEGLDEFDHSLRHGAPDSTRYRVRGMALSSTLPCLGSGTRACKRPGERPHTADSAETPYPAAVSTPQSDGMDEEPSGPGPDPSGDKRARARSLLKCQRRPSSHPGRPAKGADTVKIPSPAVPCRQAPVERAWAPEEWAGSTFPVPRPAASSSRSSALGCGGRTPTCSGPGAAEVH